MRSMSITTELFFLALVLILVVYYIGVQTDAGALTGLLTNVGNTFTGRNAQGSFANYPGGGTPGQTTLPTSVPVTQQAA